MKVLFDIECSQPLSSIKRHGGGIYAEKVLRRLADRGIPMAVYYDSSRWLNPDVRRICEDAGIGLIDRCGRSVRDIMEQNGCDRVFSALPSAELLSDPALNVKATIHGLRRLELPVDSFQLRYSDSYRERARYILNRVAPRKMVAREYAKYARLLANSDFVTVSQHTAAAIKIWFPEYSSRSIPVFYSPSTTGGERPQGAAVDTGRYMLMVSGNRWDKNGLRAIKAFERLFDAGHLEGIHVNITGLKRLEDLKYKFRHPSRFRALGYVSDDDLAILYRDAYAFIYPTLNEGFGYPPLEAMSQSVPVAASCVCSVPEVCGDAVLYFNPRDITEMANRILQLTDPDMHRDLAAKGRLRFEYIKARQDRDLDALCDYICR